MKYIKIFSIIFLSAAAVFFFTESNKAQDTAEEIKYIGIKKCKMCHSSSKKGEQFKHWETTQHAKAYETLASAEAKKIATEKGIADPQKDAQCLKCHVTAYGVDENLLDKGYNIEDGVGCETCHGPGDAYQSKKVMEQLSKQEIEASSVGLTMPSEQLCVQCHNEESPTFKGFNYEEMLEKVSHPMPEEYRTKQGYPPRK